MPKLKEYTVYTRTRGNLTYMCYNKRHALAHAVMECCVQAKWNPDEVLRWCIAEKGERKEGGVNA